MGEARVPAVEITGLFGAMVKRMSRRMLGEVPEQAGVLWNHPAVFRDMMSFGHKSEKWKHLDPDLAVFAHMAAVGAVGCEACLDLGYFMAHNKGLDEVKAREVPRWRESAVFTVLERRVMAYAEAMCRTPVAVTDEMSAELLSELGAAGLVELTARVAAANMAARNNIALGIRSQEFAVACGLPPLASRSVVSEA
jgi:alkylhydroperoxidase family enzyme